METDPFPGSVIDRSRVLVLKDNTSHHNIEIADEKILGLLDFFNNKTIEQLRRDDPRSTDGLLLLGKIEDIKDDDCLYTLYREKKDGKENICLKTGNIMGVFTLRKDDTAVRLVIGSRFDETGRQPFLCWLLERVLKVNLTDFVQSSPGEFWTILLELLFWQKLGDASGIGLYRQYRKMEYNDLRFRGKLDLDRHIRLNMPLWDKIACSRREIVFDNPINHLLRYAANIITSKWSKSSRNIFPAGNRKAGNMLTAIETNTPTWSPSRLDAVLRDRTTTSQISQPYYAEYYEDLRILARCIILRLGADVYSAASVRDDYAINGIILDGAWLWEEYLAGIMEDHDFVHAIPGPTPRSRGKSPVYALSSRTDAKNRRRPLYPDFRFPDRADDEQNALVVLDAKYKSGDDEEGVKVQRLDMHQCLAYMFLTGAKVGGVVYPPSLGQANDEENKDGENDNFIPSWKVNSPYPNVFWKSFTFPKWNPDKDFAEEMKRIEGSFKNYLKAVIDWARKNSQT